MLVAEPLAACGKILRLCQLQSEQLKPTVVTCSAAMTACEVAGHWEEGLHLFRVFLVDYVQPNLMLGLPASHANMCRRWQSDDSHMCIKGWANSCKGLYPRGVPVRRVAQQEGSRLLAQHQQTGQVDV